MYLICFAVGFLLLAIPEKTRFEWGSLAILSLLLSFNVYLTDVAENARYLNRTSLIFISGIILLWRNTLLAFYQSVILLLFLIANMCLMYDVAYGRHILIYDHFEAVIYGLVVGQFLGVIPSIWGTLIDFLTSRSTFIENNSMDYKI